MVRFMTVVLSVSVLFACAKKATREQCGAMARLKTDRLEQDTGSPVDREKMLTTLTEACLRNGYTPEDVQCILNSKGSVESLACETTRLKRK